MNFPKLHPYQEQILSRMADGSNLFFSGGQTAARTQTMHICAIAQSIKTAQPVTLRTDQPVERVKQYFTNFNLDFKFTEPNRFDGTYAGYKWALLIEPLNKV